MRRKQQAISRINFNIDEQFKSMFGSIEWPQKILAPVLIAGAPTQTLCSCRGQVKDGSITGLMN